mgnify:CR=1 FL=1
MAKPAHSAYPASGTVPDFNLPALFEDLSDAVALTGPDRRILWVNPALTRMFGYAAEELLGLSARILHADEDAFVKQGEVRFNPRTDVPSHRYEISYRRKNGQVFPSQTTASAVRNAAGEVEGYLAIIRDMSEQHAVESLLRQLYAISSSHELSSTGKIRAILRLGCERFGTSTAIVSWIEGSTYTVLLSESGIHQLEPGTEFDLGDTYCVHTLNANGPLAFHKAGRSRIAGHPCYSRFRLETYIGVPLIVDGQRFGTLNFTCTEDREPFAAADLELIRFFAAWVALELSVQNTMGRLIEAARTDPLTGCLNRKAWFDGAGEALARGQAHTLILLDLDKFKQINDTLGHLAGDEVLRQVCSLLRSECRAADLLGRVGGEEFALFLDGTAAEDGAAIAERLRARIAAARFVTSGARPTVTASFGVTGVQPGGSLEAAYERADTALYDAKHKGRNCVCAVPAP